MKGTDNCMLDNYLTELRECVSAAIAEQKIGNAATQDEKKNGCIAIQCI